MKLSPPHRFSCAERRNGREPGVALFVRSAWFQTRQNDREKRKCPPPSISVLSRPVAAHRLAIAPIFSQRKNCIVSPVSSKQEPISWNARPYPLDSPAGG
jgi:hypothetical protein